jgi:hypothetical protein
MDRALWASSLFLFFDYRMQLIAAPRPNLATHYAEAYALLAAVSAIAAIPRKPFSHGRRLHALASDSSLWALPG